MNKKIISIFAAAAMTLPLAGNAMAAQVNASIHNQSVMVEGWSAICLNEQKKQAPYLQYNGSTYIPIRTAGEWMGKEVTWDGATKTVNLSGTTDRRFYTGEGMEDEDWLGIKDGTPVKAELSSEISVVLDGEKQTFCNVKGEPVTPLVYNSTTYLPLRNIGELSNMQVWWDGTRDTIKLHQFIYLRTRMTAEQAAECKAYINQLYALESKATQDKIALNKSETREEAAKYARELISDLDQMTNNKMPDQEFLKDAVAEMRKATASNLKYIQQYLADLEGNATLEEALAGIPVEYGKNTGWISLQIDQMKTGYDPNNRLARVPIP